MSNYTNTELHEALAHADWWNNGGPQGEMLTTRAFLILSAAVRDLQTENARLRERWGGEDE